MKRFVTALFAFSLLLFTSVAGTERTLRACFYKSPGCHEIAADGTKHGYGYDFMEELAAKGGWKVEYVGYDWPWDKVLLMLEKGELDIVDFVTYRPDRAEKMLFSKRPMAYSGCAIRTTPELSARFSMSTVESWGHIRVGVMKGDVTEKEFRDFADDNRLDYEVHAFDTEAEGVEAMRRGELDLVAFEELVSFPDLVLVEICKPFADHVVTRKDNPALIAEIDEVMSAMDRDTPGWMTRLHQKYFPSPTVYAYVPSNGVVSEPFIGYIRTLLARLNEVLARNIEIRECRDDFSDADFTIPSFACGVTFTSENYKRFQFPLQSAGSRCAELLALPGEVDRLRQKLRDLGGDPVRIGYLKRQGVDMINVFEQYALRNSIAFVLVPFERDCDVKRGLRDGSIDFVICHSGDEKDLAVVETCGFIDFYLAPTAAHPELAVVIDNAFKYLRLDDPRYIYDLEGRYFGIDNDNDRLVKLGAYVESGLSIRREDGSYNGFVIDYMSEIAQRAGWHLKIVPLSFTEAQRALSDGTVDVMGAAIWTDERAKVYDYSKFDMGPLNYALMKRRDGRMLENRPDTWNGAKIGILRGSLSVKDLERFFDGYGVSWIRVPFNDLNEGEKMVREGKLDAVYALAHEDNRDLMPLVMLPTKLCYFCSNKRKPWIKAGMDAVTEELLRENHRWISDVYERHLADSRGVLLLSKDEIDYVKQCRGTRIRVSFLDEVDPILFRDGKTGEVCGLVRQIFDRLSERTGLEFEYMIGDCQADIVLRLDDSGSERVLDLCDPNWYKLPVCRVRRREPILSVKGIAAIMKSHEAEVKIARKNGIRPIVLETRDDCYRAILEGRAEYMVDNLSVAMKRLDVENRYKGLFYQRVDSAELSRPVMLYSATSTDPRLRSILSKAKDSLSQEETDISLYEMLYGGGHPMSMRVKSVLLTAFAVVLIVAVMLFLTHQHLRVARAANRAKSVFLFNMSHDIRTPMNAIRGFTEIAKKSLDNREKLEDCLGKIESSGELLQSLIDSVLDMSRVEAGKAKLEEVASDVMLSFSKIELTLQELAKARDVSLSFDFGKITDRYVYVDLEKTNRIFVNLISNAIKYSKPNGYVRVTCEQVAEEGKRKKEVENNRDVKSRTLNTEPRVAWYRYTFEDNGIGMSEDFQKHLFEEFAREHNSTTSGIQGTGLGLSLCKSFVDLMGGTITCKSKQGIGTTFVVELPFRIIDKEEEDESEKSVAAELSNTANLSGLFTGKRILIAEDNEFNREVAEFVLKEHGFEVESAEDGSVAVSLVSDKGLEYYDYILMDIQMPVMNGYEATRRIRALEGQSPKSGVQSAPNIQTSEHSQPSTLNSHHSHRHIPIIALSANAFAEDKMASIAAGMDGHVAKPINIKELMTALSRFP